MKYSIEDILKTIGKWFTKEKRIIFLVTFMMGMLIHLSLYTNQLLVEDGYWHYGAFLSKGWEVSLGRFGLPFVDLFRGTVVSSVLSTTLSCVIMAFASVFLTETLKVKKLYVKVLISLLLIVTPTFSLTLMYAYTADSYMIAMLFSVLTVYFLEKRFSLKNIIFAIISLCISLSLYQAYLGVTMTLLLFCFIVKNLEERDSNWKEHFLGLVKNCFFVLCGALLYYLLLKIVLFILHLNLNNYKGANSVFSFETVKNLIPSIKSMYVTFCKFYLGNTILHNNTFFFRNILHIILFLCIIINFVLLIRQNKIQQRIPNIILLALSVALMPIFICVIQLITQQEMSLLMAMPLFLPFVLLMKQIDMLKVKKQNNLFTLLSVIGTIVLIWSYILGNHTTYEATNMYQSQMYVRGMQIAQVLSENEEYQNKRVIIVGHLEFSSDNPTLSKMTNFNIQKSGSFYTYASFYNNYLSFDRELVKNEVVLEELQKDESFYHMPIFPEPGSIQVVDDIIVVRVGY